MPQCIGIILDGNRRWAKKQGLPAALGHRAGLETLERVVRAARDRDISHVVVYAFSTENWQRSEEEVTALFSLFEEAMKKSLRQLTEENVAVRFVGQTERFSNEMQTMMREVEQSNPHNPVTKFWMCLSYGGRAEIASAARACAAYEEEITIETIASHLWTAGMPDPDIIIRTGGEQRLSNFLLWQAAYSELFFTPTLWPDFSEGELDQILADFQARERRRGK